MPFVSAAQSRWGHSKSGVKSLGGEAKVKEWEASTDYSKLPAKASSTKGALATAALAMRKVKAP